MPQSQTHFRSPLPHALKARWRLPGPAPNAEFLSGKAWEAAELGKLRAEVRQAVKDAKDAASKALAEDRAGAQEALAAAREAAREAAAATAAAVAEEEAALQSSRDAAVEEQNRQHQALVAEVAAEAEELAGFDEDVARARTQALEGSDEARQWRQEHWEEIIEEVL